MQHLRAGFRLRPVDEAAGQGMRATMGNAQMVAMVMLAGTREC
jgi:hypothetical protein